MPHETESTQCSSSELHLHGVSNPTAPTGVLVVSFPLDPLLSFQSYWPETKKPSGHLILFPPSSKYPFHHPVLLFFISQMPPKSTSSSQTFSITLAPAFAVRFTAAEPPPLAGTTTKVFSRSSSMPESPTGRSQKQAMGTDQCTEDPVCSRKTWGGEAVSLTEGEAEIKCNLTKPQPRLSAF